MRWVCRAEPKVSLLMLPYTVGQHLLLREDFLLRLQVRDADNLQPKFHPRPSAGAPGPGHYWAAQPGVLSCHFSRRLCLTHSWRVTGDLCGLIPQSPDQFDTKQKSGFGRSPSPLEALLPSDFFLSSPVSKPADCDSLIGEQEAGRGEAGRVTGILEEGDSPEMSEENVTGGPGGCAQAGH